MEFWNDFYLKNYDIQKDKDDGYFYLFSEIRDNKTNYPVVNVATVLEKGLFSFHIDTNEKMLKRLKLPYYMHKANFSYLTDKKYYKHEKKEKMIPCLSLGFGNVKKISKEIISCWESKGYKINRLSIDRETGNTREKEHIRYFYYNKQSDKIISIKE